MARHTLMIDLRQGTGSACYCVKCFFFDWGKLSPSGIRAMSLLSGLLS